MRLDAIEGIVEKFRLNVESNWIIHRNETIDFLLDLKDWIDSKNLFFLERRVGRFKENVLSCWIIHRNETIDFLANLEAVTVE